MAARILVALSGGVDSAVAAWLLREQGLEVEALFMRNWDGDDPALPCPAEQDAADAEAVARALAIPFQRCDFSGAYWEAVFAPALRSYRAGRTPNPDVDCNREIKFGVFLAHARRLGAAAIATGHYARIERRGHRLALLRGIDADKDQSYFLHALDQEQLAVARFPLGGLRKSEVRALAREAGLPVHAKRDSTGLCFVGERPFRPFLERFLGRREGAIQDERGRTLGYHFGTHLYTLGQRAGLGGLRGARPGPWYVIGKDPERNLLFVAQQPEHPWLLSREVEVRRMHWIAGEPPAARFRCSARLRYRQPDAVCEVEARDDGTVVVRFPEAQRAVTPGQYLVLYDGELCLGGGEVSATDAPGARHLGERRAG